MIFLDISNNNYLLLYPYPKYFFPHTHPINQAKKTSMALRIKVSIYHMLQRATSSYPHKQIFHQVERPPLVIKLPTYRHMTASIIFFFAQIVTWERCPAVNRLTTTSSPWRGKAGGRARGGNLSDRGCHPVGHP